MEITKKPKNVAAITGGKNIPSRRYRIDALKPYLKHESINLTEFCPYTLCYPPKNKLFRPAWFLSALAERLTYIARVRGFDATIFQREMISTLPTIEPLIGGARILDVDDAIYMFRDGCAAKYIARKSLGVVCGNRHLADWFSQFNSNVVVIPTGVDTELLRPLSLSLAEDRASGGVIGWIGTSSNMGYLEDAAVSIKSALAVVQNSELQIISDSEVSIPSVLRPITRFIRWYPGVEEKVLPLWDIGIMPLRDGEWERGKCSFKMLQYMAAGLAVVVSPVGMNEEILRDGDVGYGAKSKAEWTDALVALLRDLPYARRLGANGRQLTERQFSLHAVAERWALTLDQWMK